MAGAGFHTIPHHPTRMHVRGLEALSATIGADGSAPAVGQLEESFSPVEPKADKSIRRSSV